MRKALVESPVVKIPVPRVASCAFLCTLLCTLLASLVLTSFVAPILAQDGNPRVKMETSKGAIVLELFPDKSPKTVENFLAYVESGYFDGTVFHRVIPDFMIQGGGFTADLTQKDTRGPVENESNNGLTNDRGTVAMARTRNPHSATSQFFVNVVDNPSLNYSQRGWGYTVFGKVVEGMEVADAISKVPTTRKGSMSDVPAEPVVIQKVTVQ